MRACWVGRQAGAWGSMQQVTVAVVPCRSPTSTHILVQPPAIGTLQGARCACGVRWMLALGRRPPIWMCRCCYLWQLSRVAQGAPLTTAHIYCSCSNPSRSTVAAQPRRYPRCAQRTAGKVQRPPSPPPAVEHSRLTHGLAAPALVGGVAAQRCRTRRRDGLVECGAAARACVAWRDAGGGEAVGRR